MAKGNRKAEDRIAKAYGAVASGVQIPMMSIPAVYDVGRKAIAEGADDEVLKARIAEFVQTIRVN